MQKAVSAVRTGLSIRRAALEYNVPKSTLGDRVSGKVEHGTMSGPSKYLTSGEEEELVKFLLGCASVGYAKTRQQILAIVQKLVSSRGIIKPVTNGWWESFCRRHPNLTLRTPAPLSVARASASDRDVFDRYYDLLEQTLAENGLEDKPCQIFNMDETGMPLDPKAFKCVYQLGEKNPISLSSGNKSQVTVVGCTNAAGYCIPPMVIWDRKTLSAELTEGEVPGTFYGLSDNGWMDQELFHAWLCNHFLRYAPPARPLLLLMDGHSSHYSPDTIRIAAKEQVILFALPPHTTHLSQPLDKGCFGPLKVKWREICHQYMVDNPHKVVTRYSFSRLFSKAWMAAMTMTNVVSGFRVTGVYPVNRNAIKLPGESSQPSLSEATGLAFIPLYSPAKRPVSVTHSSFPIFSEEEVCRFQTRFENGYDIKTDERYNRWLEMYHPELHGDLGSSSQDEHTTFSPSSQPFTPYATLDSSSDSLSLSSSPSPSNFHSQVVMVRPSQRSGLHKLLKYPTPPSKLPKLKPKVSARVLTSAEHLQLMKEKEQQKREVAHKKEERKRQREEKARERARQQEEKARLKEMKAKERAREQEERRMKQKARPHVRQCMVTNG